jgi:hypothetical protein
LSYGASEGTTDQCGQYYTRTEKNVNLILLLLLAFSKSSFFSTRIAEMGEIRSLLHSHSKALVLSGDFGKTIAARDGIISQIAGRTLDFNKKTARAQEPTGCLHGEA